MINLRNRRTVSVMEGITETGSPDMKYYAFDWDDNIASMPTKIILKNKRTKIKLDKASLRLVHERVNGISDGDLLKKYLYSSEI